MSQTYAIANLREYPQWVSEVAGWHHYEWLKGYTESRRSGDYSERDLTDDRREREHNLRSHFCVAPVPSTLVALTPEYGSLRVIGSVSLVYYQFSKQRKASEWVTNLFVVESWRERGVGQALLGAIEHFASEHQIAQLRLYTRDKEDFYRKRNWQFCHKGLVQGNSVSVLIKTLSEPQAIAGQV